MVELYDKLVAHVLQISFALKPSHRLLWQRSIFEYEKCLKTFVKRYWSKLTSQN